MRNIRKIVLGERAIAFRAEDGQEVIYQHGTLEGRFVDRQVLYSPDGTLHFELAIRRKSFGTIATVMGFEGTFAAHVLFFEDRHHGRLGQIQRVDDELTLNSVPFSRVESRGEVMVVPLPPAREPEFLFGLPDGQLLYVGANAHPDYSFESLRLYIGDGSRMRNVPIGRMSLSPERLEARREWIREWTPLFGSVPDDGCVALVNRAPDGSTCITTEEGTLFALNPLCYRGAKSWWRNRELEWLIASQYEIVEFAATGVVTIHNPL